jgi:CRP/FNR family cyclic AMP-dependent transcriptional regulator
MKATSPWFKRVIAARHVLPSGPASLSTDQRLTPRVLMSVVSFGQTLATSGLRRRLRRPQMMGVSRQTMNKALRELAHEGVLALHCAEVEIMDLDALLGRAGAIDPHLLQVFTAPA